MVVYRPNQLRGGNALATSDQERASAELGRGLGETPRPSLPPSLASFENPAHRVDVVAGIAAGVVPLKYAYAGSAAHTHDRLARSPGYLDVVGPAALEADALGSLMPYAELPSSLVEIGPGNGVRTAALLLNLCTRGAMVRRYLALDFSGTLLTLCKSQLIEAFGQRLTVHTGVWDMESGPSRLIDEWRAGNGPLVVGLLGQTLGNVENATETLRNIHASTSAGDVLVVTVALLGEQPVDDVLAPYQTMVFRAAVLEPLLAAGVAAEDIELHVRLIDATVVAEVAFRSPATVGGHVIAAGHTVRCFRSQRFEARHVPALFDQAQWRLRRVLVDDENGHAVVICARKAG